MNNFYCGSLKGNFGELLIKYILQSGGYEVEPFGLKTQEETKMLNRFKNETNGERSTALLKKSTKPDFLVYGEDIENEFLEVKFLGSNNPGRVRLSKIYLYREYWPETILSLILRDKQIYHCLRAEDFSDDMQAGNDVYDLSGKSRPLNYYFPRVTEKSLRYFDSVIFNYSQAMNDFAYSVWLSENLPKSEYKRRLETSIDQHKKSIRNLEWKLSSL